MRIAVAEGEFGVGFSQITSQTNPNAENYLQVALISSWVTDSAAENACVVEMTSPCHAPGDGAFPQFLAVWVVFQKQSGCGRWSVESPKRATPRAVALATPQDLDLLLPQRYWRGRSLGLLHAGIPGCSRRAGEDAQRVCGTLMPSCRLAFAVEGSPAPVLTTPARRPPHKPSLAVRSGQNGREGCRV